MTKYSNSEFEIFEVQFEVFQISTQSNSKYCTLELGYKEFSYCELIRQSLVLSNYSHRDGNIKNETMGTSKNTISIPVSEELDNTSLPVVTVFEVFHCQILAH
jgi:hypothetical protein